MFNDKELADERKAWEDQLEFLKQVQSHLNWPFTLEYPGYLGYTRTDGVYVAMGLNDTGNEPAWQIDYSGPDGLEDFDSNWLRVIYTDVSSLGRMLQDMLICDLRRHHAADRNKG